MGSVEYRELREGDVDAVLALYRETFARARSRANWEWRFLANPAGKSTVFLAFAEGRCVGQYAVSPVPLWDGEKEIAGLIALDHMVHPDHQGRGIYRRLEALAMATAPAGAPCYAFPNETSFPIFTGPLGWESLGQVGVYVRAGALAGLARRSRIATALKPGVWAYDRLLGTARQAVGLEGIDRFDAEIEAVWTRSRSSLGVTMNRSRELLEWRFSQNPDGYLMYRLRSGGDVIGYAVVKLEVRFDLAIAWVLDLLVEPAREREGFTGALRALHAALRERCDLLSILEPHPRFRRLLRRAGFVHAPAWLLPHRFWFIIKRNGCKDARVARAESWHLSWCLNDVP